LLHPEIINQSPPQQLVELGLHKLDPNAWQYVVAVSLGAVFFGAVTYIGNGPNFMVKAIAEAAGVPMPSFFGYIFKYTLPIMLPVLAVVWVLFVSGWVF
jgi:Na+/H+ antiporter NhaD/arsenite permease-like protein